LNASFELTAMRSRPNIYFNISSPTPGTFIIALHYKGRDKAILEMDLKIDDLLEKVCPWA
jgi:Ras GTPase-activating-like protein IQGAP2/3